MGYNILIIGGGQAAISFASRLRRENENHNITIFAGETYLPYQRPPLSKKYATGDMGREQLFLRPEDWFEKNRIGLRFDTAISKVDPDTKTVTTASGETISWDRLVFATGSRPAQSARANRGLT